MTNSSSVCMKGYRKNDTACVACEVGTYKDTIGDHTTCTSCPDQRVTDATGTINVNLCGEKIEETKEFLVLVTYWERQEY